MIKQATLISFGLMAAMIQPLLFFLPAIFSTLFLLNTLYLVPILVLIFILTDIFAVIALNISINIHHVMPQAILTVSAVIFFAVKSTFLRHSIYIILFIIFALFLLLPLPSNEILYFRTLQRSFLFPIVILLLMNVVTNRNSFKLMKMFLLTVMFISIMLIMCQYAVGTNLYYEALGLHPFYQDRGIPIMSSGLPIGFETKAFFGGTIARPLGVFSSPDKFAYFLNIFLIPPSIYLLFRRKHSLFILFFVLALFFHSLINVKAAALQFILFVTLFLSYLLFPRLSSIFRIAITAFLITLGVKVVLFTVPESWLTGSGAIQHIWSLAYPFIYQPEFILNYFFGYGFGNAYEDFKHAHGAESFVGSLMAGGGLFAVAGFFLIYAGVEKTLRKRLFTSTAQDFTRYMVLSSALWTGFFSSFFSISVLSFFQTISLSMCVLLSFGRLDDRGPLKQHP